MRIKRLCSGKASFLTGKVLFLGTALNAVPVFTQELAKSIGRGAPRAPLPKEGILQKGKPQKGTIYYKFSVIGVKVFCRRRVRVGRYFSPQGEGREDGLSRMQESRAARAKKSGFGLVKAFLCGIIEKKDFARNVGFFAKCGRLG